MARPTQSPWALPGLLLCLLARSHGHGHALGHTHSAEEPWLPGGRPPGSDAMAGAPPTATATLTLDMTDQKPVGSLLHGIFFEEASWGKGLASCSWEGSGMACPLAGLHDRPPLSPCPPAHTCRSATPATAVCTRRGCRTARLTP